MWSFENRGELEKSTEKWVEGDPAKRALNQRGKRKTTRARIYQSQIKILLHERAVRSASLGVLQLSNKIKNEKGPLVSLRAIASGE